MIRLYGNYTIDQIYTDDSFTGSGIGGGVYYSSIPLQNKETDNFEVICNMSPSIWMHLPVSLRQRTLVSLHTTRTNIFILKYAKGVRSILVEEKMPPIPVTHIYMESGQHTIINPVLGEIDDNHLKKLWSESILLAADIQGFIRTLRGRRIVVSINEKRLRQILDYIDILHTSIDEFRQLSLSPRELASIIDVDQYIVVTRGRRPPLIIANNTIIETRPGTDCPLVSDTTGAGDYFLSELLLSYIKTRNISRSSRRAFIETCHWLSRRRGKVPHHSPPPPPPP